MSDLIMRKRPAMRAGEIGLFIDTPVFESEFERIKQNADVTVEATQSRNPKQHRLFWGLAGKIAESGVLGDADARDVVDYLLFKCKHVRYVTHQYHGGIETTPIVKSIRFAAMDQTAFDRLFNRALYIVTSEILPEMPESDLRAEVEKMSGVSTPEPTPPKRRGRPRLPAKVSIIPAIEPVAAGDVPNQSGPPAAERPPLTRQATNSEDAK